MSLGIIELTCAECASANHIPRLEDGVLKIVGGVLAFRKQCPPDSPGYSGSPDRRFPVWLCSDCAHIVDKNLIIYSSARGTL